MRSRRLVPGLRRPGPFRYPAYAGGNALAVTFITASGSIQQGRGRAIPGQKTFLHRDLLSLNAASLLLPLTPARFRA